jgi:hypothetical protein
MTSQEVIMCLSQTDDQSKRSISRQELRVRRYTEADIPALRGRVMVEVPKLPHYVGVTVNADRLDQILYAGLESEEHFMCRALVTPNDDVVGGVCGYCVTQLLSWDKMTGDIFLFIDREWRSLPNVLKLMIAYRDWGIERGATIISATQTGGFKQDALGKLLERFGEYEPIGTIYYYKPQYHDTEGVRQ